MSNVKLAPIDLAAIVAAGTAVVLAPIDPKPLRVIVADLDVPQPAPAPEPAPAVVENFDNYGSFWGASTIADTDAGIEKARASGRPVDEWHVTDRAGQSLRIVRIADPDFLDDISVIPA